MQVQSATNYESLDWCEGNEKSSCTVIESDVYKLINHSDGTKTTNLVVDLTAAISGRCSTVEYNLPTDGAWYQLQEKVNYTTMCRTQTPAMVCSIPPATYKLIRLANGGHASNNVKVSCPAVDPNTVIPTATEVTTTSGRIDWTLESGALGRIEWGLTDQLGNVRAVAEDSSRFSSHSQVLSGLPADATIYYRVYDHLKNSYTSAISTFDTSGTIGAGGFISISPDDFASQSSSEASYSPTQSGNGWVNDNGASDGWRVPMLSGSHYGADEKFNFPSNVVEAELRYRFMIPNASKAVWAGYGGYNIKMPGLTGNTNPTGGGQGGQGSGGQKQWPVRGQTHKPDTRFAEFAQGVELYHTHTKYAPNGQTIWQSSNGTIGLARSLNMNTWYEIGQYVKLNSSSSARGGVLKLYLNGVETYSKTDINYTENESFRKIFRVWFNIYYGGSGVPPTTFDVFFRKFEYKIIDYK